MKIASRFLLPIELFAAFLMLSWGIAGWAGGGRFWQFLSQRDLNTEWGLYLCVVALTQLAASGVEGAFGRRWPAPVLLRSVQIRFWCSFAGIAAWLYAGYLLLTLPALAEICILLALQTPMGLVACVVIALNNRKIEVLLDPGISTQGLQSRIREERRRSAADTN